MASNTINAMVKPPLTHLLIWVSSDIIWIIQYWQTNIGWWITIGRELEVLSSSIHHTCTVEVLMSYICSCIYYGRIKLMYLYLYGANSISVLRVFMIPMDPLTININPMSICWMVQCVLIGKTERMLHQHSRSMC